jgi:hypothetical protein
VSEFHNRPHELTARRATDDARVLEGENLETHDLEDAIRWSNVYRELIEFKNRLLAQMRAALPTLPGDAASEVRSVDMAITRKQLERYQGRRAYWDQRREDLAGERQEASR